MSDSERTESAPASPAAPSNAPPSPSPRSASASPDRTTTTTPAPSRPHPVPRRKLKSAAEKSMEINDRDIRTLLRGIQKWGDPTYRYDQVVDEARLQGKNRAVILHTTRALLDICTDAVQAHDRRLRAMLARGEDVSKVRQKAVLVKFHGVDKINAETMVIRHNDLRLLGETLDPLTEQQQNDWRVPAKSLKTTMNWSVPWTAEDDAHLLVGCYRYGLGAFEQMEADPGLKLAGKFFLLEEKEKNKKVEEAKKDKTRPKAPPQPPAPEPSTDEGKPKPIPSSVHLVRRADYLLKVLQVHDDHRKAMLADPADLLDGPRGSLGPGGISLDYSDSEDEDEEDEDDQDEEMDEAQCKELLRPCRKHLKRLRQGVDMQDREATVPVLKLALAAIGQQIEHIIHTLPPTQSRARRQKLERHLWTFASYFWPSEVQPTKMRDLFAKLVQNGSPALDKVRPDGLRDARRKRKHSLNGSELAKKRRTSEALSPDYGSSPPRSYRSESRGYDRDNHREPIRRREGSSWGY